MYLDNLIGLLMMWMWERQSQSNNTHHLSPHKWKVAKEEVLYMLQIGVIEPADGAWSSPVLLAAKEGRPDHFWKVNFRKVSHVTNSDAFPILRLEDCIDQVGRAKYVRLVF